MSHSYCSACGHAFPDAMATYPRSCAHCGHVTYCNPLPVGVVLQPVGEGLLIIQRDVDEGRGDWALPGGFLECGESWQKGTARELWEETGLQVAPNDLQVFQLSSSPDGRYLMIFALAPPLAGSDLPAPQTRAEVSDLRVMARPEPLAFPLHEEAARRFFEQRQPPRNST
ncbi:MAG: NUDIX domain-containing protein [Bacteroidetes bacterium]|nr:MAG: NUDIX domain-containing protein [Bacteroidota bacterium]